MSTKKKKPLPKDKANRIVYRYLNGVYVKYHFETHAPMLIRIFMKGGDIPNFCAEAEICNNTFHEWKKKYKPFREIYEIAKELAHSYWISLLPSQLIEEKDTKFNYKVWQLIMRNRFNATDTRKVRLAKLSKCKTTQQKIDCIIDYVAAGELTAQESTQLANIVLAALKVEETTDIKKRLEHAEELLREHT